MVVRTLGERTDIFWEGEAKRITNSYNLFYFSGIKQLPAQDIRLVARMPVGRRSILFRMEEGRTRISMTYSTIQV